MRRMTGAFLLGTVLCALGASLPAAQARRAHVVVAPRERLIVQPPPAVSGVNAYWDSNIIPRYRYRPQDDRIDPYGPPVVPVVRYGPQEETAWWYWRGY